MVYQKNLVDQKKSEPDQKFPETEQIFFGRPKKGRNRLDNWLTKRLTKTTWMGLKKKFGRPKQNEKLTDNWYTKETDQKYMNAAYISLKFD